MDNTICYLNTDLDLGSRIDLSPLEDALRSRNLCVQPAFDNLGNSWFLMVEVNQEHTEPEESIAEMLATIEAFEPAVRKLWDSCFKKEFNIGYDCGAKPWAFNQGLSAALLGRIGAAGAGIRITLYPDKPESSPVEQPSESHS